MGAKGIGEIGIVGTAAAVANAVHHATGVRVRDLPIRLDRLLDARPRRGGIEAKRAACAPAPARPRSCRRAPRPRAGTRRGRCRCRRRCRTARANMPKIRSTSSAPTPTPLSRTVITQSSGPLVGRHPHARRRRAAETHRVADEVLQQPPQLARVAVDLGRLTVSSSAPAASSSPQVGGDLVHDLPRARRARAESRRRARRRARRR